MNDLDRYLLRCTFDLAQLAREHGNHPFGALLADDTGRILLEAENTVVTDNDCTCHAETNLMRLASRQLEFRSLVGTTLYASAEPCPMCAGAIYWGGVRRVVFGLSQDRLYGLASPSSDGLLLPARDVFAHARHTVQVIGPLLEDEAVTVHQGFWA